MDWARYGTVANYSNLNDFFKNLIRNFHFRKISTYYILDMRLALAIIEQNISISKSGSGPGCGDNVNSNPKTRPRLQQFTMLRPYKGTS